MSSSNSIRFFFPNKITLASRKELRSIIASIFRDHNKSLKSLNYIFCSDKFLLNVNREFLQHNEYTDIITFDLGSQNKVEGEIYISVDRVKENARLHKTSQRQEICRVIFHGALHLCGYKDKTRQSKNEMTKQENRYLRKAGFSIVSREK